MAYLGNLQVVLSKLSKIEWSKLNEKMGKVLISNDGLWELSYSIKELEAHHSAPNKSYPLQVLIVLRYEGKVVMTWGCETNQDNLSFLEFFKSIKRDIQKEEWENEKEVEDKGKEIFDNL